MEAGAAFLVQSQADDGAWRGTSYAVFRDGAALTPLMMKALAAMPPDAARMEAALRGARFMQARMDEEDQQPSIALAYPVYTAALMMIALSRLQKARTEQNLPRIYVPIKGWRALLVRHQLNERLGWRREDLAFGGWGYSLEPPKRPEPSDMAPPFDSDLSSTLFAVSALRTSGTPASDPAIANARIFIERCQNLFTDGGFFFTPTNEIQNKAGVAGTDPDGRMRFHSYGSATADGVRALVQCGRAADHPRVVAGLGWLERNFSTTTNPGEFTPAREPDRDAAYFYYMWSLAHALRLLGMGALKRIGGEFDWTRDVEQAINERQRPDGSWSNRFSFMKEDDPLVATPLALGALGCATLVRNA